MWFWANLVTFIFVLKIDLIEIKFGHIKSISAEVKLNFKFLQIVQDLLNTVVVTS